MTTKSRSSCVLIIAALGAACASATLRVDAGHDGNMPIEDPVVRRFAGHVSLLGPPGQNGHLYAFETAALRRDTVAFPPGSLRSWRLTFVSGERLGAVFRV